MTKVKKKKTKVRRINKFGNLVDLKMTLEVKMVKIFALESTLEKLNTCWLPLH